MVFNSYKSYLVLCFLFLLSLSDFEGTSAQINSTPNKEIKQTITSVFQKINMDFSEGTITIDESILYMTYSIFAKEQLPTKYQYLESDGELTWVFNRILRVWDELNQITRDELMKFGFSIYGTMERPSFLNSTKESAHFKVFYSVVPNDSNAVSTIDENTNGTPDYVESVLSAMEYVWESEINSMGFTAPPSDSISGGNSKYDIYLYKLKAGTYGIAFADILIGNNPNSVATEKNAFASYIALRNDYSQFQQNTQFGIMQATAAHELFHAIQYGYDTFEKAWLMEATAAWIEDEVYDDININVQHLPNWFAKYWVPLNATKAESTGHWYGSWIYFRYISEHLGGHSTIKKIWEQSIKHDSKTKDYSIKTIDEALKTKNSSFKESFKNFAISNLYQTTDPYNYEEAELYPPVSIVLNIIQSNQFISHKSNKFTNYYFRVFPNTIPGTPDEIEFTLTPVNLNAKIELVVTTKTGENVEVASSSIIGESIKYTLQNSSLKNEIYAIVVNSDTINTDFKLDVKYKGNLVQLNKIGNYNYGQLADNTYIYKQSRESIDVSGNRKTDFIITHYNLNSGNSKELVFPDTYGLSAYLAKTNGDIFVVAGESSTGLRKNYGFHYLLKELEGDFYVNQYPAVDNNKVFFYGDYFSPDFTKGIFLTNLKTGPPQMILDLTSSDFSIDIIASEKESFVALKNNYAIPNSNELISYTNNSLNTFYSPGSENIIISLVFDDNLAVWSETDNFFSNGVIKAFNFSTNRLKTIREVNGLDAFSVATSLKRVVWWENTGNGAKIKLWMDDTTTTIRTTFKGLYLDDNGVGSSSFDVPIDTGGVAWMETDFTLFYYSFSSSSLNSYDLSSYFTDNLMTGYLVKLSGKNIIIQALSSIDSEKLGTYLFKLKDITTGINDKNNFQIPKIFSLSQNFPNPFNPTTVISYSIPAFEAENIHAVQLKIYDILGREIKTLVNEKKSPGVYKVDFDASNLSSGIYFYRIIINSTVSSEVINFVQTKKMLLIK